MLINNLFYLAKIIIAKKLKERSFMKIAVAGTGYVGLSIATLLAQHNTVTAVDIIPEKVELINNRSHRSKMTISRNTLQKRNLT